MRCTGASHTSQLGIMGVDSDKGGGQAPACAGNRERLQARAGGAQPRELGVVQLAVVHLAAPGLLHAQPPQCGPAAARGRVSRSPRAAAGPPPLQAPPPGDPLVMSSASERKNS